MLIPVDPAAHSGLIHSWVRERRAKFWGMTGFTPERVRATYELLAASPTHHAWLIVLGGRPSGILQSYEPHADVAGALYRVAPGDLGLHVLLAPVARRAPGTTGAIASLVLREIAAQGRTRRVVAEPDSRNDRALARLEATGFTLGPRVELPHKTGRLAFLDLAAPTPARSVPRPARPR